MANKKANKMGAPSPRISSEAGQILGDKKKPKEDRSVAGYTLGGNPAKEESEEESRDLARPTRRGST